MPRRAPAKGRRLIECLTYRYSGHSRADPAKYRPAGRARTLERSATRIKIYRERLAQFGIDEDAIAGIEAEVQGQVDDATRGVQGRAARPRLIS